MLQDYLDSNSLESLIVGFRNKKVHWYLSTRPEVEGFKRSGFYAANLAEVGRLRVQSFVASLEKLHPQGKRQTSVYQIVNGEAPFTRFILAHYARNISLNHGSTLNTRNDFYT